MKKVKPLKFNANADASVLPSNPRTVKRNPRPKRKPAPRGGWIS